MRHLHDELLAGLALGEPDHLGPRQRSHLLTCRACRARLEELRGLVATGRSAPPDELQPPRAGLLAAIQAEIAADRDDRPAEVVASAEPGRGPGPLHDDRHGSPRNRPGHGRRLLAAAAVLAVAVGGTLWYRQSVEEVLISRATLTALPDKTGRGSAELVRRHGVPQLRVDLDAPAAADRFEELWLINTDGRRMISLGVVPATGRGSYPVPTAGGALEGYTVVDVSLEPYDGDAAHSRNSVLRGTLDR